MTLPVLLPPSTLDPHGGFIQGSLNASHGYTIATYLFPPPCGFQAAKAVLFSMHGILGHCLFEWLAPDEQNHRTLLKGSLVDQLLQLGVVVIGYDHPGHGRSSGLHAYVDSHDHLRDVGIDVINHFMAKPELQGKKKMLMGMSMGGTTAIRVCMKQPDLLDAVVLVSPAVRPPDDMFGAYGHFLKAISPILGFLVPKLPVLKLPPSPDPTIRDAVEKDGLVHRGALRVNMGMEFLRVYTEIDEQADQTKFKSVVIMIGKKDNIVSPSGIYQFHQRIQSPDKKVMEYDGLGHEVLREEGCHLARHQLVQWVNEHL